MILEHKYSKVWKKQYICNSEANPLNQIIAQINAKGLNNLPPKCQQILLFKQKKKPYQTSKYRKYLKFQKKSWRSQNNQRHLEYSGKMGEKNDMPIIYFFVEKLNRIGLGVHL